MSFFFLLLNQRTGRQIRSCTGTSGRVQEVGKGHRRVNIVKYCVHMYVNGKMRPVETIPGTGEGDKGE
jgi:hypothetical protein